MRQTNRKNSQRGFTLMETLIAMVVLAVGILGLAAMLGDSLAYMKGSQDDFIAQRNAAFGKPDYDLQKAMRERLDHLLAIGH